MSTRSEAAPWLLPAKSGACACAQLRRAARRISSLYDAVLKPSGLTNTQHSLLVNVARAGAISRTALAERLGMDRTTLTRNLRPLETLELIVPFESDDRRERLLCLSTAGTRKLKQSYELWQQAQHTFASRLGRKKLEQLRSALKAAEDAAEEAGT